VSPTSVVGGVRASALDAGQLDMFLNNTLEAVEDGRRELLAFFEFHALDGMLVNRIEVIFEELVANAVRHGLRPGSNQTIHVHVRAAPGGVELTLEDDGVPFDPFVFPLPEPPHSLAEAKVGGLGIPLVVRLSAARRYERPAPCAQAGGFAPTNRVTVLIAKDGPPEH